MMNQKRKAEWYLWRIKRSRQPNKALCNQPSNPNRKRIWVFLCEVLMMKWCRTRGPEAIWVEPELWIQLGRWLTPLYLTRTSVELVRTRNTKIKRLTWCRKSSWCIIKISESFTNCYKALTCFKGVRALCWKQVEIMRNNRPQSNNPMRHFGGLEVWERHVSRKNDGENRSIQIPT